MTKQQTKSQTVLKVGIDLSLVRKAKNAAGLLALVHSQVRTHPPPDWLHFTSANGEIIASPASGLVASCIDGNEFHDDFFVKGRLVARPEDVYEMAAAKARRLTDALVAQISAYDHDGSVVLGELRWLGTVPKATQAKKLWAAAFDAWRGMLPAWEPPAGSASAIALAAPAQVKAAWNGGFAQRNEFTGSVWAPTPTKVKAIQAVVCGGARGGHPFVFEGVVYGATASTVGALDISRAKPVLRWEQTLASGSNVMTGGGFIDGDRLVLALGDRICALRLTDGQVQSSAKVGNIVSAPVRFEDTWMVATKQGAVAVDLTTGRKRWSCALPNKYGHGALALSGELLFNAPDQLFAIDARTGKVQWKALDIAGAPVATDNTVYAAAVGGVFALDARTGKKRWAHKASAASESHLALGAGVLAFRTDEGLLALDAQTGKERWRMKGGAVPAKSAVTFVGDCALFVRFIDEMGDECELVAVDAKSGRVRWRVSEFPGERLDRPDWYSAVVPSFGETGALDALVVPTGWGVVVLRP
ncbi:MAG: PQQ-binding-like beta-propeller repeat protein [Archangium sp.]|nr:PQQ-binding-like beta-propeller repeat protein [Archangium sp.]